MSKIEHKAEKELTVGQLLATLMKWHNAGHINLETRVGKLIRNIDGGCRCKVEKEVDLSYESEVEIMDGVLILANQFEYCTC